MMTYNICLLPFSFVFPISILAVDAMLERRRKRKRLEKSDTSGL